MGGGGRRGGSTNFVFGEEGEGRGESSGGVFEGNKGSGCCGKVFLFFSFLFFSFLFFSFLFFSILFFSFLFFSFLFFSFPFFFSFLLFSFSFLYILRVFPLSSRYYFVEYYWNLLTYLAKRKERNRRFHDFVKKGYFFFFLYSSFDI